MFTKNDILGVLGTGNMGEAILRGVIASGGLQPGQIIGSDALPAAAERVQKAHGIRVTNDNVALATEATMVLLAVKPYLVGKVVDSDAMRKALAGKLVMSVAAGVKLEDLQRWLPDSAVVRAMPNTPCLIGQGMTAIARGNRVTDAQMTAALAVFSACGRAIDIEEKHMDVVTALVGSGPAFAFLFVEALADGGVLMGLPRDKAITLAAQTVQGAARMILETGKHPAVLKDQVTTPGGCTIAGLGVLEEGAVRGQLIRTIEKTAKVASGLG